MKKYMAALALGALVLTGCGDPAAPEQVHPTHAGPNSECVEFDGEPCDDDPFDTDDSGDGSHKKPSTVKTPAPKPSVIPGQRAPIRITPKRW